MTNYLREQIDRKKREIELQKQASNIYTIHPKKSDLILLYEVVDKEGRGLWGGEDTEQAITWFKKSALEQRVRIMVSAWDSDDEDAHLVGQTIDITPIVIQAWNKGKEVSL
jgi:uncharacterized LabA/DUF88 family protein